MRSLARLALNESAKRAPQRTATVGFRHRLACWSIALLVAMTLVTPAHAEDWRYVVPGLNDSFGRPSMRSLALTSTKPASLTEKVAYKSPTPKYAELRVGQPERRVTLVVDRVSKEGVDLYVDGNMDGTIAAGERCEGADLTWRCRIAVPLTPQSGGGGIGRKLAREFVFRFGKSSGSLSVAAVGFMEGEVLLGEAAVAARRVDDNANGLFDDRQDRLLLDLNRDGKWNAVTEQFAHVAVLRLGQDRYAVNADTAGQSLTLSRMEGEGRVGIDIAGLRSDAELIYCKTRIVGSGGVTVTFDAARQEQVAPVGDYRLAGLELLLRDRKSDQNWSFTFADHGRGRKPELKTLNRDGTLVFRPLGKLDFFVESAHDEFEPGTKLLAYPRLYTEGNLMIAFCDTSNRFRGSVDPDGPHALVELIAPDGAKLDSQHSGFACGTFCGVNLQPPATQPAGPLQLRATFRSGPLAGDMSATITLPLMASKDRGAGKE